MKIIQCEVQYNALFERTKDAVFLLDLNGVHITANQKASEMFGYDADELKQLTYKDLSLETKASDQVMQRLLNGETIPKYRRLFKHKDGRTIPVEIDIEIVRNTKGSPLYLQSIVQDISDRVAFENLTNYNSKFQKLIIEIAIEFLKITPPQFDEAVNHLLKRVGEFCNVDRTYYFRYDYTTNTTSNTHEWCADGITPEIDNLKDIPLSLVPEWVDAHVAGNEVFIPDIDALEETPLKEILAAQNIKTLITVPVMNRLTCLGFVGYDAVHTHKVWTDEERALIKMLSILIGNAEVKLENERKLTLALSQAESANSAKTKFLANISHEVRTPLNGIMGMLSLLMRTEINPIQKGHIDHAQLYAKHLLDTLNAILDYARMEKDSLHLKEEPFKLSEIVDEVKAIIYPSAQEKGLALAIEVDPHLPEELIGDHLKLKQILLNLLTNSVKFTHTGSIYMTATLDDSKGQTNHDINLLVSLKDTGIGIDSNYFELIFEPFTQVDDSINRRYEGTGLGLSIVKELIKLMRGDVSIESTLDVGTTFYIKLPFKCKLSDTDDPFLSLIMGRTREILDKLNELDDAAKQQKPKICKALIDEILALGLSNEYHTQIDTIKRHLKHFDFEGARLTLTTLIKALE